MLYTAYGVPVRESAGRRIEPSPRVGKESGPRAPVWSGGQGQFGPAGARVLVPAKRCQDLPCRQANARSASAVRHGVPDPRQERRSEPIEILPITASRSMPPPAISDSSRSWSVLHTKIDG